MSSCHENSERLKGEKSGIREGKRNKQRENKRYLQHQHGGSANNTSDNIQRQKIHSKELLGGIEPRNKMLFYLVAAKGRCPLS
jgi:hypothetical protein